MVLSSFFGLNSELRWTLNLIEESVARWWGNHGLCSASVHRQEMVKLLPETVSLYLSFAISFLFSPLGLFRKRRWRWRNLAVESSKAKQSASQPPSLGRKSQCVSDQRKPRETRDLSTVRIKTWAASLCSTGSVGHDCLKYIDDMILLLIKILCKTSIVSILLLPLCSLIPSRVRQRVVGFGAFTLINQNSNAIISSVLAA